MTTLVSAPAVSVRPVRWQRLAWVAWRRYRITLVGVLVVVALLAVDLVYSGHQIRTAYAQLMACTPADSARCRFLDGEFQNRFGNPGFLGPVLLFLPGLLGVFAGAPIIARELESGTFRYAWTQGVGRTRWAVALLVPGAVGGAAIVGAFGMLVSWQREPLIDYGIGDRLQPAVFSSTGVAAAAWTLMAFALGTLAGVLWRRVVPALATAFAAWFGLAFVAAEQLRNRYLPALHTTSLHEPRHALVISQWWTRGGVRVDNAEVNRILESYGAQVSDHSVKVHVSPGGVDPIQALVQQGYRQVTAYQPDSRYWTFQWIESGGLVVLSLALLGLTLWLLRRRAA